MVADLLLEVLVLLCVGVDEDLWSERVSHADVVVQLGCG